MATFYAKSAIIHALPGSNIQGTLNGNGSRLQNIATPVASTDGATKNYVDTSTGIIKAVVAAVQTTQWGGTYSSGVIPATGNGAPGTAIVGVIDGVNLTLGTRVLLIGQTTATQNGVYSVTTAGTSGSATQLTRTTDWSSSSSPAVQPGWVVAVTTGGTTYGNTMWELTATMSAVQTPIVFDTTSQVFTAMSGPIDNRVIGGVTPRPATFTTLTANSTVTFTSGTIDGIAIGATTASTGKFTTLQSTGAATVLSLAATNNVQAAYVTVTGTTSGGTIDNTAIGATTAYTGRFTTLTATGAVTFTSGTIDGIVIGGTTPAAGHFTTLSTTSTFSASSVSLTGGTVDGTVIGGTTAAAGTFTTTTCQLNVNTVKTYSASGAINLAYSVHIFGGSSALAMTVANGAATGTVMEYYNPTASGSGCVVTITAPSAIYLDAEGNTWTNLILNPGQSTSMRWTGTYWQARENGYSMT